MVKDYHHAPVILNGIGCALLSYVLTVVFQRYANPYMVAVISFISFMLITNTILWGVYKKL